MLVKFYVLYALEFFCLSVAKLVVLDRMKDFVSVLRADDATRRWTVGGRIVMAAVLTGNAVGLVGNIVAAMHFTASHLLLVVEKLLELLVLPVTDNVNLPR